MKATISGNLVPLEGKCSITIPRARRGDTGGEIVMNNLPEISDTKSAIYNNEGIIGRATPLYTYSHSGDRNINIQIHFFIVNPEDAEDNLASLRLIQSAVYPRCGGVSGRTVAAGGYACMPGRVPYKPPPVCKIRCGDLLATGGRVICAVLQSYSVRFPTEVAWDEETMCPYRFDVDTSWLVVYTSSDLPFQTRIVYEGV